MQIGELATLVGLSTRAIRHYHHRGVLPEPARRANGYRDYGLRHVVLLARIRRLAELGLSLDEVRDTFADSRDLLDILVGLDNDLGREEARIRERRARLATLIERARTGHLEADDAVSPEVAAVLGDPSDSPMATRERELLALLDTVATPADRARALTMLRAGDPTDRGREFHRRLDELADAPVDDLRVPALAAELAEDLPPELWTADPDHPFCVAVLDAMAPAQAEVIRRALRLVSEKAP
jgi:DNA-binding transcriptional MerR regulator